MNWTGGRLQRHSENAGQKHRFPKSRLRNDGAQLAPVFQGLSQFQKPGDHEPVHQPVTQPSTSHDPSSGPPTTEPSQPLSRLDRIKRQFLETNDWAAVGATRPVKMTFTPTEELERFGKRRKLTEADRSRLVSSGKTEPLDMPISRDRARRASSELRTVGNVDIRISGPREHTGLPRPSQKQNNESSQPMLLDRDEFDCQSSLEGGFESCQAKDSSHLLLSSDESAPLNPSQSLSMARVDFPVHEPTSQDGQAETFIDSISQSEYAEQTRSPSRPNSTSSEIYQPIPQYPRRFTIDDQIAAEHERVANAAPISFNIDAKTQDNDAASSYVESPLSSESICNGLEHDFAMVDTQSTSSNQFSGWLPEPRHKIQRFIRQDSRVISEGQRGNSTHDVQCPRTESWKHYTSPVKLFGQSISVDDKGMGDGQYPEQIPNSTLHRVPIGKCRTPIARYTTPSPHFLAQRLDISPERYVPDSLRGVQYQSSGSTPMAKSFEITRNPIFTPFRQRIPRQGGYSPTSNSGLQGVYGQQLPATASLHPDQLTNS